MMVRTHEQNQIRQDCLSRDRSIDVVSDRQESTDWAANAIKEAAIKEAARKLDEPAPKDRRRFNNGATKED
jgi:hypothetical protein